MKIVRMTGDIAVKIQAWINSELVSRIGALHLRGVHPVTMTELMTQGRVRTPHGARIASPGQFSLLLQFALMQRDLFVVMETMLEP